MKCDGRISFEAVDFFQRGNEGTRVIFIEGKYIVIVLAGDVIPRVFRLQGIKFYIIYTMISIGCPRRPRFVQKITLQV